MRSYRGSSAVCRGPAENTENTPSGSWVIGQAAAAGHRAGATSFERIVGAGVEHENGGAHLIVLEALDDAVGEYGGIAHQFLLPLATGRQQEVLPGDFKTVTGVEKERNVAGIHGRVERQ